MKLTVKTLKGSHFEIRVQPTDTVMAVKKNIEDVQGKDNYPCGQQLLIHNGKVLKDETTLAENKVSEDGFLVVMLSKVGGRRSGGKRFALLMACKDSDYVKKVYGGYFNVFVAAFGEEGDTWDLFRVVDGEFPDVNQLQMYDGFVVSGSPFDAFGNDLWILKLCFRLQLLDSMEKKILGICFGHQALCRALGGKVSGWDLGLRKVKFVEDLSSYSFLNVLKENTQPSSLSIIECHQDEVWEVPLGADVIASSDKTGVESFTIGDHILGIQGHPEYTKDILFSLIDRLLNENSIKRDFAEDAKLTMEKAEPDRKTWQMISRSFLMGR